jgi:hypothetical protein
MTIDQDLRKDVAEFKNAVFSVRANFIRLQQQKIDTINQVAERMVEEKDYKEGIHYLKRLNAIERRYFNLVYAAFLGFNNKIFEVTKNVDSIKHLDSYEEGVKAETLKAWQLIYDICCEFDRIFQQAKIRIADEERHITNAESKVDSLNSRKEFVAEYEKYLNDFRDQSNINSIMLRLNGKKAAMDIAKRKLISISQTLESRTNRNSDLILYMVLVTSIIGTVKDDIYQGVFSLVLGAMFYTAAHLGSIRGMKNVLGRYKYVM